MPAEVMVLARICAVVAAVGVMGCASTPVRQEATPEAGAALALVARAQMRLEAGEIAEGLQLFREAVALRPEDLGLREELGLALASVGLADQAVSELTGLERRSSAGNAVLGMLLARAASSPQELERAVPLLREGVGAVPEGDSARLMLVQVLLQLGRGEEALEALRPLLADQPLNPRLNLLAGSALRLAGRPQEAEEYLNQARQAGETQQPATAELIEALASDGKLAEAAELLQEFMARQGMTLAGLTRLATLWARAGERDKALSVVDEVLSKDPQQREALLLGALLHAGKGKLDLAEQYFRKVLASDPDDADAAMGLARLLLDTRFLDESRRLLDGLWRRAVEAEMHTAQVGLEIAQDRATIELVDRRPEAAREWLDRMTETPPGRRTLALWGEYFRLQEHWREGLEWLDTAAQQVDSDAARLAVSLRAEFLVAAGEDATAEALLEPLFEGSEDDVSAALGALQRRDRYEEVVRRARAALQRLGEVGAVHFALAASLERSGQWEEAVAEFRSLLQREPDNAAALNYLGYMFADRNVNLEEALEMISQAVELEPTSGAYQDSLGWVYFRLGDLARAEKHLREAGRLEPHDGTVHEHLGDLHAQRGERQEAVATYTRALAMDLEEAGQRQRIEEKLEGLSRDVSPQQP